jgi:prepilin-type N-terminal cleavage/methylation domain-containing protein
MRHRSGFTLLELALVVVMLGTALALATPRLQHARHVFAVRAARAELAGAVSIARVTAVRSGGATLHIDPATGMAWIEAADGSRLSPDYPLAARFGVGVATSSGGGVALRYDGLGIGRMANASVTVSRGSVSAGLTISAYGRVRL